MTQAITRIGQPDAPMVKPSNPLELLTLAVEKGADPDKLTGMYDLYQRWQKDQAAQAFGEALAKFQSFCPRITKRRTINIGKGPGAAYASYDDIMREITPVLSQCGLSVTFTQADMQGAGTVKLGCTIRHGTHSETTQVALPVPTQMSVNDTQKMGAALSYAKRYALCAALNIVVTDEDDDAGRMQEQITYITEAQAIQLDEMIQSYGADRAKFLDFYGIKSTAELPASRFQQAFAALQKKGAKKGDVQ